MIRILDWNKIKPEEILNRDIRAEEDVSAAVDAVIADVRQRGDQALLEYTERFDGVKLAALEVTAGGIGRGLGRPGRRLQGHAGAGGGQYPALP